MSDERIFELFPDPDTAARVCAIRDQLAERYESWGSGRSDKDGHSALPGVNPTTVSPAAK